MVKLRDFDDVTSQKKWINQAVLEAFKDKEYKGKVTTLKITNPKIEERHYYKSDQKKALLLNKNLVQPIKADVSLIDNETGTILDTKNNFHIASMPYHTDARNTIISNGVDYTSAANQLRLRPGVYVRKKQNGEIESHYNLQSGTGSGFRIGLDPEKGLFNFNLGTINAPLYPFLKAMGANDEELKQKWGDHLFNNNKDKDTSIVKFYEKLVPFGEKEISDEAKMQAIVDVFAKARMDPEVNMKTLGKPFEIVNKDVILDTTDKIIKVSRNEVEDDYRDALLFKKIYSVEDFYKEKVQKDAGKLGKALMYRLDRSKDLTKLPTGYFSKQLWGVIKSDPTVSPTGTLAQPLEEINPIDIYEQQGKVTILGEGGIGDEKAITLEARNVHPSQVNFIDYIRTPESSNVGIDQRVALNVKKGDDNQLYKEFINVKTGKREFLNPLQVSEKTVAFPYEMDNKDKKEVDALVKGEAKTVPKDQVDYAMTTFAENFSTYNNLVPMLPSIQGNRSILASKALSLTMPLKYAEAPLVQVKNPLTGRSFEKDIADKTVNVLAQDDGEVVEVTADDIFVKSGKKKVRHDLYNNFPFNRKTYIHNTPLVKVGDKVKKGDLLARSNYSDKDGTLALGVNLNAIYVPFLGWNFEDAYPISETAAKKLTSEQMYSYEYDIDDEGGQVVDKTRYMGMFPTNISKDLSGAYDDVGLIKPGTVVKTGQPLILAMEKRPPSSRDIQLGNLHKTLKTQFRDAAIDWDHHTDGVVTDVVKSGKHIKVLVKTESPANIGDKITGRYGNKGVISVIIPDAQMPIVKETGERVDIIMNPVGVPSRINPAQNEEHLLNKIVKKTGKSYILESADPKTPDLIKFIEDELEKNKVSKTDTLVYKGREIPGVETGPSYIWKLSKMSEGEMKRRGLGGYDSDQQPIKGKADSGQALRVGNMELNAFIGHGAKANLRERSTILGQSNPEFWRTAKLGFPLASPKVPFVYDKFKKMLMASGINIKKNGIYEQLFPLTDKDTLSWSSGQVTRQETLYSKDLTPVPNGLFDPGITGGVIGQKWSHIELAEKIPNPVMEDTLKKIMRINEKEFKHRVKTGTMEQDLKRYDLDTEIAASENLMKTLNGSRLDIEIKRLSALKGLKNTGTKIQDLMIKNVPVLPPVYRPISVMGSKNAISMGSANLLYKDLLASNQVLEMNKKEYSSEKLESERFNNYKAVKAVVGLGDPINIKNLSKGVSGFISEIVGEQPKTGYFQKRVLSKTQDLVTRGVAVPDPTLSLDQISIPKESAWKDFGDFVIRRMTQNGISAVDALTEVKKETPRALQYLQMEMKERPILMNRNPSLHKYNIMAFNPILNNDNVIKVAPQVVTGFNLDFDGDQVNIFVPATPEAVKEDKEKLLPSKNLFHIKDRKVHYLPSQGTVLGLHALTLPGGENKKPVKIYNNIEELRQDYLLGKIKATDTVELKK